MNLTKDDIPDYAPETIQRNGWTIRVEVPYDENMGPPWEEHDGHGIVSEWTRRAKAPGEMVLAEDRGSYCYYDFAESVKLARKDGWGPLDKDSRKTPGERAHLAALEDFKRLRGWCSDEWTWVGVVVTATAPDGTESSDSLWGIESDGDYWRDVAAELANGLIAKWDRDLRMEPEPYVSQALGRLRDNDAQSREDAIKLLCSALNLGEDFEPKQE